MRLYPTVLISLALLRDLVSSSDAHHGSLKRKRHLISSVAESVPLQLNVTSRALERRFDDARFTFFATGLGACGKTNSPSDFIVALNSAQYAGGAHCFEPITITVGSKTHSAQIVDECPGCPFGGLDFSTGLFTFFAPESVGVLTGSWNFGGSAAPPPPPPPAPPKKFTPPPPPPPKSTQQHTTVAPSTSITHTSRSSTAPSNSVASSTQSTTSSSAPIATATNTDSSPAPVNNIEQMYLAFVQMGSIAMAAPGPNS